MANNEPNTTRFEVDQTLLDSTIQDETGRSLGAPYVTCLLDGATGQVLHWWLEASAALPSEEPPPES